MSVSDIQANSYSDYEIVGQLGNDTTSLVSLRYGANGLQGTIFYEDEGYELININDSLGVIFQYDYGDDYMVECGTDSTIAQGNYHPSNPIRGSGRSTCTAGEGNVRVLILHTDAAALQTPDINATAQNAIDRLNATFFLSRMPAFRVELAGVDALPEFVETGSRETYISQLFNENTTARNRINQLRVDNEADLVILLTGRDDNLAPFGVAEGIGPPNFFAFVKIAFATQTTVFTHEAGHLFGCRHQAQGSFDVCPNNSGLNLNAFNTDDGLPFFSHPRIYTKCSNGASPSQGPPNKVSWTLMNSSFILDTDEFQSETNWKLTQIPVFSHKRNIFHRPYLPPSRVGEVGSAENTKVMVDNAAAIKALFDECVFAASMTFSATEGHPGDVVNLSANSEGCESGTVTYTWEFSANGFDYNFLAAGASASVVIPQPQSAINRIYIRLIANCSGDPNVPPSNSQDIIFRSIAILDDDAGCDDITIECISSGITTLSKDNGAIFSVAPNPTEGLLTMTINKTENTVINGEVYVQDLTGKVVNRINNIHAIGEWSYTDYFYNLKSGIYFVNFVIKGEKPYAKKIVVR